MPVIVQGPTLPGFRNGLVVLLFGLLLLFNYGFMQVRVPGGVPVTEFVLVIAFLTINHFKVLPRFLAQSFAIPLMLWWGVGIVQILSNIPEYGIWAIRDGAHVIESLFLYVGFTMARNPAMLAGFSWWLPRIFILSALYGLLFPFREMLKPLSPILAGAQGQDVSLLFNYTSTAMVMVAGAAYFFNGYLLEKTNWKLYLSLGLITSALLFFPSRTLIMDLCVFLLFFIVRFPKNRWKLPLLVMGVPITMLAVVGVTGITLETRLGSDFRPQDYLALIAEILPGGGTEGEMVTSGTAGRLLWWFDIFQKMGTSVISWIWGLGYGMPLLDFKVGPGVVVREPHNDFISILARGGVFMLAFFIWFQLISLLRIFKLVSHFSTHPQWSSLMAGVLFLIIGVLVATIGESPFLLSFYAMPYYFLVGILNRLYAMRRQYE